MNEVLERHFAAMGARLQLAERPWRGDARINVRGRWFSVRFAGEGAPAEVEVVDVRPREHHLLLLVRGDRQKHKFLCGHDERHWFVAAIPEDARGVTGVRTAMAALQPQAVRDAVERVRPKDRYRRRNAAYVRQGEWFFVPAPSLVVEDARVLRDERLTRGWGQVHVMEYAYRVDGELVYVSRGYPRGLTSAEFYELPRREREAYAWDELVRDPEVYAKGAVRHPDHATIHLWGWHRVHMNTEAGAQAMRHVAFLD